MIDRRTLLSLLICPACHTPLERFDRCAACGAAYDEAEGTPVLIAPQACRRVAFDFAQSRSTAGTRFAGAFSYPPRYGAAGGDKPYHLDLAHYDVIDQLPPGAAVLEIGCGGGQMRAYLEGRGIRYVGVDISKTRIAEHLQRHGGPDLLCDAHFLPFGARAFDVVYSSAVTEHLACPHLVAQEVARVLKPGGYYLGNVSFLEPWHDHSFFHMSPLGAYELLTQADFDVLHVWPGKGYSGFRALLSMGNKATRRISFVGSWLHLVYRTGNHLGNLVKRRNHGSMKGGIEDAAKVAGATDWIARRR